MQRHYHSEKFLTMMNSTIKGEEGMKDGAIPLLDAKELGHNQRTTKNFTTAYKISADLKPETIKIKLSL